MIDTLTPHQTPTRLHLIVALVSYAASICFAVLIVPHVMDIIEKAGFAPWYVLGPNEADSPTGDPVKALWAIGLSFVPLLVVCWFTRRLQVPKAAWIMAAIMYPPLVTIIGLAFHAAAL